MNSKALRLYAILSVLLIIFLIAIFRGNQSHNTENKSLLDPNYSFSKPIKIVDSAETLDSPSLILGRDNKFYLVWSSTTNGISNLWMSDSIDGKIWTSPWQITNTAENDLNPSLIQGEDGIFYVAWQRNDLNAENKLNIWYAYSFDGKIWNTMQQVTRSDSNDITPSIILDDNNRNVLVWSSDRSGSFDLYISFLDPIGWREPINITNNNSPDTNPHIHKRTGSEYGLAWNRQVPNTAFIQGLFSISADGISWATPISLSMDDSMSVYHPFIYPCDFGYCGSWAGKSQDNISDLFFANLSNPQGIHRATGYLNRNDTHPQIAPTDQEDSWLLIWVGGKENNVIYSRFIELNN